jgi:benzoate 4-monooxygenase
MVHISRRHISINDADAIPFIYGLGGGSFLKSAFYDAFIARVPSVFSTINRGDHARKRRLTSHAFSIRSLKSLAPFVHEIVEEFAMTMDTLANTDAWIDTTKWFNLLAWDVISSLAFGEPIGFVSKVSARIPTSAM